jgi:hypothetical protein
MDRNLPEDPEILRLVRSSEAARESLARDASVLCRKLDVAARFRDSLRRHPASWLLGSLASGLAASLLLRPARTVVQAAAPGGFPLKLLGLTLTAARPLAKVWLANQAKRWLASRAEAVRSRPIPSNRHSL